MNAILSPMERSNSLLPRLLVSLILILLLSTIIAIGGGGEAAADDTNDYDRTKDTDGDGLTDWDEVNIYQTDPELHSFYQDDPRILEVFGNFYAGETPTEPTSLEENIRIYVHVISSNLPEPNTEHEIQVTLHYKTLTEKIREETMTLKVPKSATRESILTNYKPERIDEIWGMGYTDDQNTVAYRLNYTFGIGQFSTGEEISYYITVTPAQGSESRFPWKSPEEDETFEKFKVEAAIIIVDEITDEAKYALLFSVIFGSFASMRMKKRLSKMSYTDIQWWDAVNRKAFVKVITLFRDVNEVKQVLKRISGRSIRFLYFTGITGLLMLSFELLYNPEEISQLSLGIIGFFLMFTVTSPVLYVYFSRWKHKNRTIGKIRLLFFLVFPILIAAAFGNGENVLGYTLVFMFFYSIPMLLYGNLMGTNWNFLIFNSYKEFATGFDHLTNSKSGIGKRIFAFFFFWAIFIMPILSINSLFALKDGTYDDGGFLGKAAEQIIKNFGYDYYAQIFTSFIAVFIILNVVLLGVAMVFRVVQLQFYASQKFSGKMGFGLHLHFKIRDSVEDQRKLIAFAFFVFFGYSVLLLLLAIYSQISYLLPTVPGLSADILKDFLHIQSIFANIIFTFFWFVSLPKLRKMFGLKRHADGFIIPK